MLVRIIIAIILFFAVSPLLDALANFIIAGNTLGGQLLAGVFKATYGVGLILAIFRSSS